jgi:hypothetical protein
MNFATAALSDIIGHLNKSESRGLVRLRPRNNCLPCVSHLMDKA